MTVILPAAWESRIKALCNQQSESGQRNRLPLTKWLGKDTEIFQKPSYIQEIKRTLGWPVLLLGIGTIQRLASSGFKST